MSKNVLLLKVVSVFALITLIITSCNPKPAEIDLTFESIEQKEWSGSKRPYDNREPGLMIISSTQEVANAGDLVAGASMTKLGQTNFDEYFVVIVLQGLKPSSGYSVNIEHITQVGKTVSLYAQFNEPKPDEAKTDEVTSPYQIVQVKKNGGNWGEEMTVNLVVDKTTVASLSHFIP